MRVTALKQVTYDPSVFMDVDTVDEAMRIILTPEAGMSSAHRWKTETPYLMSLMEKHIARGSTVLDYGCGIGRVSKPLIEKHGCIVIGADIAPNMRALAASCVGSDSFFALHPDMLMLFPSNVADAAIAVWTLQHCVDPKLDLHHIAEMVKPGGTLFIVNNMRRVVPVSGGRWADDQIDIDKVINDAGFGMLVDRGRLQGDDIAPPELRENTFWAVYRKS